MPRGGRRPGAGRKPKLTYCERLEVGAKCESLHRESIDRLLQVKLAEATVNLGNERKLIEKETGQSRYRIPTEDLENVLRLDKKLHEDKKPSGLIRVAVKRPKGQRNDIIARVASETGHVPSMVDKCWKEYRAMMREEE